MRLATPTVRRKILTTTNFPTYSLCCIVEIWQFGFENSKIHQKLWSQAKTPKFLTHVGTYTPSQSVKFYRIGLFGIGYIRGFPFSRFPIFGPLAFFGLYIENE